MALVAVLSLVAAACGSGRSEGTDTTTTTAGAGGAGNGGGGGEEMFGEVASPCGEGDASGATAQGVTDSSITIGYGDDAGFPNSPGLNHEMSDAIKGMIKWCNDLGGINGREVVGNYYDAKITEVNNVMTEACSQVFMLVGQGWSLDSAQEQTRLGCDLASVPGFSVSPQFANGRLMVQAVPNPVDFTPTAIAYAMAEEFPDKVTKAAAMYANYAATIDSTEKVTQTFPQAGWNFLDCAQEYNINGESDWKPFAQRLKDCGAEVVFFSGSPFPNFQNLLDAAAQLDFKPIWVTDANFYDLSFAQWNVNGNGDNVYVREAFLPLNQADSVPAIQKYIDVVEADGGDTNQLGMQSASSFLLWAQAAKACGSELTRDCVMSELANITDWTGGGLHAETNPTSNLPPECGIVLKLDGTKYLQHFPEEEGTFDCDPKYVAEVTGPVVDKANLNADRISQPG